SSTAVLNGTINPNGQATTWTVQYGTTPALGSETATQSAGSGTADVPVQTALTGLAAGSTLYYRFAAQNSRGSDQSATQSQMLKPNPTATAGAPGAVTSSSAVLNGTINPG